MGCGKVSRMWLTLWQWETDEGTEKKPYELRGTLATILHLLRWRAKTNTLKVLQKNYDFVFADENVLAWCQHVTVTSLQICVA